MTRYVCTFAAALLLICVPVKAQQPGGTAPLTLEQCLNLAMANQTDVVTARNNVIIAKGRSAEALAQYLPQLSIQNNAFKWGTESVLSRVTTGTALNVSQNVFDGGLREANTVRARYGVTQNEAGLIRTIQTTTYNVTRAYYDALRAKHLADVAQTTVTYNEELLRQVRAAAEQGTAAKADVLPVEAQLANARVNLITAKNNVKTSLLALQTAVGLAPKPDFDIVDVEEPPSFVIQPLEAYIKQAMAARPDVVAAKAGAGAARASLRAARINLYPRPVINAEYQKGIEGGFTTSGGQMVGGIVFDLFNGGANRAAYREAEASAANATQAEKQAMRDIPTQVEEAYLNLTSSRDRLDASDVGLKAAQVNYDAQKERYALGSGTVLDTLNAQVQLTTAQSNAVQARYDYYTAIAQLNYAIGSQGGHNVK